MALGKPPGPGGRGYSLMTPAVVIRPTWLRPSSVNHSAPSGPAVMPKGELPALGSGYAVRLPEVVMRPILFAASSVNHSAPSDPSAMPTAPPLAVVSVGYSVTDTV